jgi:predicted  nucleic acid-binding Zn-ribbon protein
MKLLRTQVRELNREHKYLATQIERHSRYAPPLNNDRHYNKLTREMVRLEKQMTAIERVIGTFPNDMNSYI